MIKTLFNFVITIFSISAYLQFSTLSSALLAQNINRHVNNVEFLKIIHLIIHLINKTTSACLIFILCLVL